MHFYIKNLIFALSLFLYCAPQSVAQDILARQAPSDKRLRATDSVSLHKPTVKSSRRTVDYMNVEPYSSWSNGAVKAYSAAELPDHFRIDLRDFVMPTPSRNITSRYGYRSQFRRNHYGLDVKVYIGDTIVSAWDGKVRVVKYDAAGWGRYILIRHANGLETLYAHLSKQLVEEDQEVKAGEVIGLGGNTGRSTGSHLHLECRLLGEPINPEYLFDFPHQCMTGEYYDWTRGSRRSGIVEKEKDVADVLPEFMNDDAVASAENEAKPAAQKETATTKNGKTSKEREPAAQTNPHSRYYKVKRGDTAYSISRKVGVSVDELLRVNRLGKKAKLREGQVLKY